MTCNVQDSILLPVNTHRISSVMTIETDIIGNLIVDELLYYITDEYFRYRGNDFDS
jgi:hypothetical protein